MKMTQQEASFLLVQSFIDNVKMWAFSALLALVDTNVHELKAIGFYAQLTFWGFLALFTPSIVMIISEEKNMLRPPWIQMCNSASQGG